MKILITISDVRNYRQLGKQVNQTNFDAFTREIQENELTELLGEALIYDFFEYLENAWISQAGTFTRNSDNQFTAVGIDLSTWVDYALRINNNTYVIVENASFGGADTIINTKGYVLPDELASIDYKAENNYIRLLNGDIYTDSGSPIKYNGLRPFICWKFLALYTTEGSVKHSDTGNFSIMPDNRPNGRELAEAKSIRLQNSMREYNRISKYLNNNRSDFPLWKPKNDENITNIETLIV